MALQKLAQHSQGTGNAAMGRELHELTLMARALSHVEIRRNRVDEVAKAIEIGAYRVPTGILAACLMFEMLH